MKLFDAIRSFFFGPPIARAVVFGLIFAIWGAWRGASADAPSEPVVAIPVAAFVILILIRLWYMSRMTNVEVKNRQYARRDWPLMCAQIGLILPMIWVATPLLGFADYESNGTMLVLGSLLYTAGLLVCWRSHADLRNGLSPTLEIKKNHELITVGLYSRIRHPMYLGFILFTIGQAMAVPNAIAGPFGLVGMSLLILLRVPQEEKMMSDEFAEQYTSYCERTNRLIPGIW